MVGAGSEPARGLFTSDPNGRRIRQIRPYTTDGDDSAETIVAVDPLGAGIGERVLVVFGRAARHCIGRSHDIGFQTAVSAIIDKLELEDGRVFGSTSEHDQPASEKGALRP